ncbi:hypothetical protein KVR01_000836 [Diaporthe batatas]|uniref:uncharacterized protein n=1 Tax=Diaporthe batatas TaxID=748121 RepID=UPI001D036208|nr:uncharacterized protein KVR01_000836 [Diaporthe batatas]KAG8170091.1 hypothetical protein KVR01_000836 [Diaporthe batatas]
MEEINAFVRAAALNTRQGLRGASNVCHFWEEDHFDCCNEPFPWNKETSTDTIRHQHTVITADNLDDERPTGRSYRTTHTTCPRAAHNRGWPGVFAVANDSTNTQSNFESTKPSPTKPGTKSMGIAILAAAFFFIKKKVNGGDKPKARAESFDFGPPSRTNPNLSRAETAAMAELMRIAYRVENEGDVERGGMGGDGGGGAGVSYYPGVPPKMAPNGAGVVGVATTPYEESRRADNVTRMQSLGSESVAQLGLKHPVGRWVHVQRPGAVATRTSAYDVPDMPVPNTYHPDRYSSSNPYSGVAR